VIENPDQAVVSGVAAATIRARAAAFAFGAAAIREGQRGAAASEGLHTQASAIADRVSLLPALRPSGIGEGEPPFDQGPQAAGEEAEEADEAEAAEGAFEIVDETVFDVIEIIL
jgi:hypothetical protein